MFTVGIAVLGYPRSGKLCFLKNYYIVSIGEYEQALIEISENACKDYNEKFKTEYCGSDCNDFKRCYGKIP